jgi:hypothetical protein
MNKKITVKFKNGKITAKGDVDVYHIQLAAQKLRNREVELPLAIKTARFIKRFVKSIKHSSPREQHITVVAKIKPEVTCYE